MIPLEDQREATRSAPEKGIVHVILATSIAESSLTIPCVTFVVDTGWHRVAQFDPETQREVLETVRCTPSSMVQRRGRAGRTQAGLYLGLYEKCKRDVEEDDVRIRGAIDKLVLQAYVTSETPQWKLVKSADWLLQRLPVPPSSEHLECADDALTAERTAPWMPPVARSCATGRPTAPRPATATRIRCDVPTSRLLEHCKSRLGRQEVLYTDRAMQSEAVAGCSRRAP